MAVTSTVKVFKSSDAGAPALNYQAGSLLSVLDACLVDGFNSKSITGVTWNNNEATYTAASHGFVASQYVKISGVVVGGSTANNYNSENTTGDYKILSATTNTFTVWVGSNPGTYSSGGTVVRAPAGNPGNSGNDRWTKTTPNTNQRMYTQPASLTNPCVLRVDDNAGYLMRHGRENATSVTSLTATANVVAVVAEIWAGRSISSGSGLTNCFHATNCYDKKPTPGYLSTAVSKSGAGPYVYSLTVSGTDPREVFSDGEELYISQSLGAAVDTNWPMAGLFGTFDYAASDATTIKVNSASNITIGASPSVKVRRSDATITNRPMYLPKAGARAAFANSPVGDVDYCAQNRYWMLVTDGYCFYLFVQWGGHISNAAASYNTSNSSHHNFCSTMFFGDFVSYKSADTYNKLLASHVGYVEPEDNAKFIPRNCLITSYVYTLTSFDNTSDYTIGSSHASHFLLPRAASDATGVATGRGLMVARRAAKAAGSIVDDDILTYPDPVTGSTAVYEAQLLEAVGTSVGVRGKYPGMYGHMNKDTTFVYGDTLSNVSGLSGRQLMFVPQPTCTTVSAALAQSGYLLDLTGPWR